MKNDWMGLCCISSLLLFWGGFACTGAGAGAGAGGTLKFANCSGPSDCRGGNNFGSPGARTSVGAFFLLRWIGGAFGSFGSLGFRVLLALGGSGGGGGCCSPSGFGFGLRLGKVSVFFLENGTLHAPWLLPRRLLY